MGVHEIVDKFLKFLVSQENIESIYGEVQGGIAGDLLKRVFDKYKMYVQPKQFLAEQEEKEIKEMMLEVLHANWQNTQTIIPMLLSIMEAQTTPYQQFTKSYDKYANYLSSLYNSEDLFNSTSDKKVTLENLYVEPFCEIYSYQSEQESKNHRHPYEFLKNDICLPRLYLDILTKNYHPCHSKHQSPIQFFLLFGKPGQGKSSFCKRFLHDYITSYQTEKQKVFYLRLRDLTDLEGLESSPIEKLKKAVERSMRIILEEDIVIPDVEFESGLLVLDGLDELQMVKEKTFDAQNAVEFCYGLLRELKVHSASNKVNKLKIFMTSRYGRINPSDLFERDVLIARLSNATKEEQLNWLSNYQNAGLNTWMTKEDIEFYHKQETQHEHILELMQQPILLNIVAKLVNAPKKGVNRAQLYKSLFDTLLERPYDDKGMLDIHVDAKMHKSIMRQLIREVAFAVFQSGREYIHKDELIKSLSPQLQSFFKDADSKAQKKDLLRALMMSFYIQERPKSSDDNFKGVDSDYAIEFVHKSLQEYMTTEYIWEHIREKVLEKSSVTDNYIIDNAVKMIHLFSDICLNRGVSLEIKSLLLLVIKETAKRDRDAIAERLEFFISDVINANFYDKSYERANEHNNFLIEKIFFRFYLYWYLFTYLKDSIDLPTLRSRSINDSFFKLFMQSYGSKTCNYKNTAIGYLGLEQISFHSNDFSNSYIYRNPGLKSESSGFMLIKFCSFNGCNFYKFNFSGGWFSNCKFYLCDFSEVNFGNANFRDQVVFQDCILTSEQRDWLISQKAIVIKHNMGQFL